MKKFLFACIILTFSATSFAKCFYQEIEPVCSLSGETYTSTCDGWSDTSTWSIPDVYVGMCDETPELSDYHKGRIVVAMDTYFRKYQYYGPMYESRFDVTSKNLNLTGQAFINEQFFPAVKASILAEREKQDPDLLSIAMLHYGASVVGYDYFISMPDGE